MSFPKRVFTVLLVKALFSASAAVAQNSDPELPTAEDIRQIYDDISGEWPEIPSFVALAVRHAEDTNFFAYPKQVSNFAISLGKKFSPEKPLTRRKPITRMSITIGEALSYDEILNWYMNDVAMGQGCRGIRDAGMAYFGKAVENLNLEQIAYLAVIQKRADAFHPVTSYDQAIESRNFFISMLAELEVISAEDATIATNTALVVKTPLRTCDPDE